MVSFFGSESGWFGCEGSENVIRHAKGLPFWTVLHNQAGRLEGNGEFLGDLDQFLEAVGGVGFLFAAELTYLFQKEERAS